MTKRTRRTTTLHVLRIVEEEEFDETEPPSLPGIVVEAEEVPEPSRPPLARTSGDFFPWARKVGS